MSIKQLHIAVGIIRNAERQIFITQRAASAHMAGFWEFPGGKIEAGETPEQALHRELLEETGIVVEHALFLQQDQHDFSDRQVTLYFYLVDAWRGDPYGREGQPLRWVAQQALQADDFPSANGAIVRRLLAEAS